ncbi:MAG: T9SS type A sorting domain-containing protein [Chitinophagales bacterium]
MGTNIDATASFSENCGVVSPVLVNAITVQGQGGVSTISTNGGTLQMEADVLPLNADDATYTWSVVNTSAASISATGLLTALANGDVDVIATANDGSGITGAKTITISNQGVGIKDLAFESLNVYPNPTTGIVNIAVGNEKISSIKIIDLAGRVVKQYSNESQINVSSINVGIYMLEIANEDKRSIVKLIVR